MAYIEVDIDLSDFDADDIITEVQRRIKHKHGGAEFKKLLLAEIDVISTSEYKKGLTVRDEQYEEVFEQLKQQYSVSELEKLLKVLA